MFVFFHPTTFARLFSTPFFDQLVMCKRLNTLRIPNPSHSKQFDRCVSTFGPFCQTVIDGHGSPTNLDIARRRFAAVYINRSCFEVALRISLIQTFTESPCDSVFGCGFVYVRIELGRQRKSGLFRPLQEGIVDSAGTKIVPLLCLRRL
jgi:hypothetical protein